MKEFFIDVILAIAVVVVSPIALCVLWPSNMIMQITRPFGRRIPGIHVAWDWWDEFVSGYGAIQIGWMKY